MKLTAYFRFVLDDGGEGGGFRVAGVLGLTFLDLKEVWLTSETYSSAKGWPATTWTKIENLLPFYWGIYEFHLSNSKHSLRLPSDFSVFISAKVEWIKKRIEWWWLPSSAGFGSHVAKDKVGESQFPSYHNRGSLKGAMKTNNAFNVGLPHLRSSAVHFESSDSCYNNSCVWH